MDRDGVELLRFYEKISEQATEEAYGAYLLANAITLQLRAHIKLIEKRLAEAEAYGAYLLANAITLQLRAHIKLIEKRLAEAEARPRWKKLLRRKK